MKRHIIFLFLICSCQRLPKTKNNVVTTVTFANTSITNIDSQDALICINDSCVWKSDTTIYSTFTIQLTKGDNKFAVSTLNGRLSKAHIVNITDTTDWIFIEYVNSISKDSLVRIYTHKMLNRLMKENQNIDKKFWYDSIYNSLRNADFYSFKEGHNELLINVYNSKNK